MGVLCIDLAAHEVTVDSRPVQLTQQEFALLRFLCQNRGRVYSRQQLLERVWGVDYYGTSRTVDIHVRRLRHKLGAAFPLVTLRGTGYKHGQWLDTVMMQLSINGGDSLPPDPASLPERKFRGEV